MTRVLALALALLLSAPGLAQEETEDSPPVKTGEFDARIAGVRYAVHLRTGRELKGVVRVRGVFERRVKGVWEECDPEDKDAGVRLWFPARQDGYTFHPVSTIERVEEQGAVTPEESKLIQKARRGAADRAVQERRELRRRLEEAARLAAEKAAGDEAEAEAEAERVVAEKAAVEAAKTPDERAQEKAYEELLVEFPPTDWKPDRPEKIQRRRVILGLFPSDEEKAFLEVFDEWKLAYEWWEKKVAEQAAEKSDGSGDEGGAGGTDGPKKAPPADERPEGAGTSRSKADARTAESESDSER